VPAPAAGRRATESRNAREAVRLTLNATCSGNAVDAEVAVSNVGVGHPLPTGVDARSLILEVVAHDRNDAPLALLPGPTSIERAFSESSVTVRPRLLPFATDVTRYRFAAPKSGPAHVSARLVLLSATGTPSEIAGTATDCRSTGDTP